MECQPQCICQPHASQTPSEYPDHLAVAEAHSVMVIVTVFVALGTWRQHQCASPGEESIEMLQILTEEHCASQ